MGIPSTGGTGGKRPLAPSSFSDTHIQNVLKQLKGSKKTITDKDINKMMGYLKSEKHSNTIGGQSPRNNNLKNLAEDVLAHLTTKNNTEGKELSPAEKSALKNLPTYIKTHTETGAGSGASAAVPPPVDPASIKEG